MKLINRLSFLEKIGSTYDAHPACALLGPRQCGKTTLARQLIQKQTSDSYLFDLEDPLDVSKLEYPKLTLEPLGGLIVIDEIQRRPELFPYLRVLIDTYPDRRYLILGSASHELIQQSSETLAGRIEFIELTPFSIQETQDYKKVWLQGGFPRSYLAVHQEASFSWRKAYIMTFLEKDVRALGFTISTQDMRRLWTMLAHYHGNILNYSELGRSLGLSDMTIRRYIHVLEGTFMIRILKPWFANIHKRQVKSPKVYFRDSGLLHVFLNIVSYEALILHPKVGASWEGFALEEIIRFYKVDPEDCYFWSLHGEAELDLMLFIGGRKIGFEIKYSDSPKLTKSMQAAQALLQLDEFKVIIPGNAQFKLSDTIEVQGLDTYGS